MLKGFNILVNRKKRENAPGALAAEAQIVLRGLGEGGRRGGQKKRTK